MSADNDIGAIRIAANESYFEVAQRAAPGFIQALRRATIAPEDEGLVIEPSEPRDQPPAAPRPARHAMAHPRPKPVWKNKKPKR